MKIMIATPMYGGNAKSGYVLSLQNLVIKLATEGYQVETSIIGNESLITRARNSLTHKFMNSDADTLLFIDSDHSFNADDVLKMIESDKELIAAIYPMKGINWGAARLASIAGKEDIHNYAGIFAVNVLDEEQELSADEPIKVAEIGTGLMLIKKSVFQKMEPLCDKYISDSISVSNQNMGEEITEFFKTSIDPTSRRLLSEDYNFCHMWRKLGNDVWAAPWVKMTHIGNHSFTGSFESALELTQIQKELLKKSEEMAEEEPNTEKESEKS